MPFLASVLLVVRFIFPPRFAILSFINQDSIFTVCYVQTHCQAMETQW